MIFRSITTIRSRVSHMKYCADRSLLQASAFWVTGLLLLCSQAFCAEANLIFPDKEWIEATPASQGVDAAVLAEAMAVINELGQSGASEVGNTQTLVIRNGYLIWKGTDIDTQHRVYSCTKSVLSSVLGLLYDDKKCGPDTKAGEILPAMAEHYPEITLGQMANFTSGYQVPFREDPLVIRPPLHPPGAAMHYSTSSDQLSHLLTRTAQQPLRDLFQKRIGDVIGINPGAWDWASVGKVDGMEIAGGSGSLSTNARQLARFGLLYLAEGQWKNQQVISKEWVKMSTRVQVPPTLPPHDPKAWYTLLPGRYGYNWWVNGADAKGELCWPDAPPGTFAAQGLKNNYCFVIPEWRMVLVSLDTGKGMDARLFNRVFEKLRLALPNTK
jgi:CubicO group peptidase (beta-lactamase class C family)